MQTVLSESPSLPNAKIQEICQRTRLVVGIRETPRMLHPFLLLMNDRPWNIPVVSFDAAFMTGLACKTCFSYST